MDFVGSGVGVLEGDGVLVGASVTEAVKVGSPGRNVGNGVGEFVFVAVLVWVGFSAIDVWSSAIARLRLPPSINAETSAVSNPTIRSRYESTKITPLH